MFVVHLLGKTNSIDGDEEKAQQQSAFIFQAVVGSVTPLTSCFTAPLEPTSSSLALMRQATVRATSELSACNIFRGCVLASVIWAHMSVTAQTVSVW